MSLQFARKESLIEKEGGFSLGEETIEMREKGNSKKTNYCC